MAGDPEVEEIEGRERKTLREEGSEHRTEDGVGCWSVATDFGVEKFYLLTSSGIRVRLKAGLSQWCPSRIKNHTQI